MNIDRVNFQAVLILLTVLLLVGFPIFGLGYASIYGNGSRIESVNQLVEIFSEPLVEHALKNTMLVGFSSSILATCAGVLLSWIVVRTTAPFRGAFRFLIIIPLATTPFVGAFAWSILASPRAGLLNNVIAGWVGFAPINIHSVWGITWVVALYLTPYVYLFVSAALESLDSNFQEASLITGASPLRSELAIILPLVLPQILSGFLLVFILSLEEFGASAVLGLPARQYVLSTALFARFQTFPPDYPSVVAMAILLVSITAIGTYLYQKVLKRGWSFAVISGKSKGLAPLDIGLWRYSACGILIAYLVFTVVLPIGILIVVALSEVWQGKVEFGGFTVVHFAELIQEQATLIAIKNSVVFALLGALVGVAFGFIVARVSQSQRNFLGSIIEHLSMLPLGIPGIVIATGLIFGFLNSPLNFLYGTAFGLLAAYIIRYLPHAVRGSSAALLQINWELVESAYVTGASPFRAFVDVLLPLLRKGLLGTGVIVFASILRELAASIMLVVASTQVISTLLFGFWHDSLLERAAAFSLVSVGIALGVVALAVKLTGAQVNIVGK